MPALNTALANRDLHGICTREPANFVDRDNLTSNIPEKLNPEPTYFTKIRVHRLFEIIQQELSFPETALIYAVQPNLQDKP